MAGGAQKHLGAALSMPAGLHKSGLARRGRRSHPRERAGGWKLGVDGERCRAGTAIVVRAAGGQGLVQGATQKACQGSSRTPGSPANLKEAEAGEVAGDEDVEEG